ncbi:MAG: hypothetical protein ACRDTA_16005 [Pseudonocardiaceae bacterium]
MTSNESRRRHVAMALVIAALLVLGACSGNGKDVNSPASSKAPETFPMTVQSCDREVTIQRPPERVITQGVEAPALVAAAGAVDRIVARNDAGGTPLGQYAQALPAQRRQWPICAGVLRHSRSKPPVFQ